MTLDTLVRPDLVFTDLPGSDRQTVLRAIAERMVEAGVADEAERLYRKLLEREELGSTCVQPGVAIPHCKLDGLDEVFVSVGICPEGVEFGGADDAPVRLFFTVISPAESPAAHLQSLALISRWIKGDGNVERLLELSTADEMLELMRQGQEVAE